MMSHTTSHAFSTFFGGRVPEISTALLVGWTTYFCGCLVAKAREALPEVQCLQDRCGDRADLGARVEKEGVGGR